MPTTAHVHQGHTVISTIIVTSSLSLFSTCRHLGCLMAASSFSMENFLLTLRSKTSSVLSAYQMGVYLPGNPNLIQTLPFPLLAVTRFMQSRGLLLHHAISSQCLILLPNATSQIYTSVKRRSLSQHRGFQTVYAISNLLIFLEPLSCANIALKPKTQSLSIKFFAF